MAHKTESNNQITSVSVEGFRSLRSVKDLKLPPLSVLIGSNGAGKSNLIRFFEMISWMLRAQRLQEFIVTHGGGNDQFFMGARQTPRISATICIRTSKGLNEYRFDLLHIPAGDKVIVSGEAYRFSASNKPEPAKWFNVAEYGPEAGLPLKTSTTAKTITHLLRQCATFQFHDTSKFSSLWRWWDVTDNARMRSDGGNLASILHDLRERQPARYAVIVWQIQRVLPNFGDFVLEPVEGKVLLRWRAANSDMTFGPHLTSDGSLRLFCLFTLLNMPLDQLPDVLFFDEPELGLHPHAITLLAEMLKRVSEVRQVFVATQSPYLVDCFELDDLIIARNKDGATALENLSSDHYRDWLENEYLPSNIWLMDPVGGIL